jgi:hypothetical protein
MTVKGRPVNGRVDRFFTISRRSVVILCHEAVFEMACSQVAVTTKRMARDGDSPALLPRCAGLRREGRRCGSAGSIEAAFAVSVSGDYRVKTGARTTLSDLRVTFARFATLDMHYESITWSAKPPV